MYVVFSRFGAPIYRCAKYVGLYATTRRWHVSRSCCSTVLLRTPTYSKILLHTPKYSKYSGVFGVKLRKLQITPSTPEFLVSTPEFFLLLRSSVVVLRSSLLGSYPYISYNIYNTNTSLSFIITLHHSMLNNAKLHNNLVSDALCPSMPYALCDAYVLSCIHQLTHTQEGHTERGRQREL